MNQNDDTKTRPVHPLAALLELCERIDGACTLSVELETRDGARHLAFAVSSRNPGLPRGGVLKAGVGATRDEVDELLAECIALKSARVRKRAAADLATLRAASPWGEQAGAYEEDAHELQNIAARRLEAAEQLDEAVRSDPEGPGGGAARAGAEACTREAVTLERAAQMLRTIGGEL